MTAAAGNGSPVTKGDCGTPIGHEMIGITRNELFECQKGLSIVMK
jgi:hypothetical protein